MGDHLPDLGAARRHRLPRRRAGSLSAVRTTGLRKAYGSLEALRGVDLDVPTGALYGLIGPNGSGKTTLLEILAGLRRRSAGELDFAAPQSRIAYCPDVAQFEPWLSATEVLECAVGLLGRRAPKQVVSETLERVGLAEASRRRVGGFSRGMTTRLNIAAALVAEPAVLLVDEPASSLDPAGRVEILALVASLAPATTVLLSSHDLDEVEAICSVVGILAAGRLVYQGELRDLVARSAGPSWRVVVRPPIEPTLRALEKAPWVESVREVAPGELEFSSEDREQVERCLVPLLGSSRARVVSLSPVRPSLEDIFLELTSGEGQAGGEK